MDKRAWCFVWGVIALMFAGFWAYGLFDLDEGIYAAALSEMARKHEWIVITFRGEPFFEKPILIYWLGLLFTKAGVPGVIALRLPSVLATIGTLVSVALFSRKRFGNRVAIGAVLLLGTSLPFMLLGRMFTPDAWLTFAMTAAYLSFIESLDGSKSWRIVTGLMLGIAVLAKGPMPVFVFLVIAAYAFIALRQYRSTMLGGSLMGLMAFCCVVAAWYVPVALREGTGFFNEFILKQNLGRLQGGDTAHLGPLYYYIPVLILSFVPASVLLPLAWQKARSMGVEKLLWVWAIVVFLLFSVAGSKLPHYILPALPPLAILLAKTSLEATKAYRFAMLAFAVLAFLAVAVGLTRFQTPLDNHAWLLISAIGIGVCASGLAMDRGTNLCIQAAAFAFPAVGTALVIGAGIYWQSTHADSDAAARFLARSPGNIIEYRTSAEKERGQTAHPSMLWTVDRPTAVADTPEALRALARPGDLILSRGQRFDAVLPQVAKSGVSVVGVFSTGRFQIYRVESNPTQ